MISSQNLMKSVSKTAKMPSGRKLRGMHMSCNIIHCQKCNSGVLNLLDATTAKYDNSCAKRRCIFMQRTNLLCKKNSNVCKILFGICLFSVMLHYYVFPTK